MQEGVTDGQRKRHQKFDNQFPLLILSMPLSISEILELVLAVSKNNRIDI
jgi:hypothetical protein